MTEGKGEPAPAPGGTIPAPPKYFVGQPEPVAPTAAPAPEAAKPAPAIPRVTAAQAVPMPTPTPVPVVAPPPSLSRPTAPSAPQAGPGTELPEFRKMDVQVLLQDLATSHRTLYDERRNYERQLLQERDRSRFEQERIRDEYGTRVREVEKQNEVLIRNLGRVQGESDHLREELAVLRFKLSTVQATPAAAPAVATEPGVDLGAQGPLRVVPPATMLMGRAIPFEAPPPLVPRRP